MDVPYDRLDPETLRRLIINFVTRDGTDYGLEEATLESKINQVQRQLEIGEAVIVFDDQTHSVDILSRSDRASRR